MLIAAEQQAKIAESIGCGPFLVAQAIQMLSAYGLLSRVDEHSYRASAHYFGGSRWIALCRGELQMVLTVSYDPTGRTIVDAQPQALPTKAPMTAD